MTHSRLVTRFLSRLNGKWLYIGLGIKRWLLLLWLGMVVSALGAASLFVSGARPAPLPEPFDFLTLQFLDRIVGGLLCVGVGIGMVVIAIMRLNRSLVSAFSTDDTDLVELVYRKRVRDKGPKIVALGGGTGLSTLLRGLKEHSDKLTAIVTVADDGGSSGRLRREMGILPPGDFRQCIAALADSEPLMSQLLQYRFGSGAGLEGHSFGNLFIVAMAGITGNFERALAEASRVLAVRGQVLPSTLHTVTLLAETRPANAPHDPLERVAGESQIGHRGRPIERVYLDPEHCPAYPGAVRAILDADLIVAGPGSLFTSVLPNLLVEDVRHAIEASNAVKVYVCNVATQPGETDQFAVEDHLAVLQDHIGSGVFTHVLANGNFNIPLPATSPSHIVRARGDAACRAAIQFDDIVDEAKPWRHDPQKLARAILKFYQAAKHTRGMDTDR